LLDDLHWADAATIELLPALADLAVRQPLAFVGTYRSDDLPRGHPLRRTRTELGRAGRLQELVVEPLDRDETRLLAAGILGGEVCPVLGAALWDRSQGVPFFVEELAFALQAGGRVLQTERGLDLAAGTQVPLPETVGDAVLTRVDGLEPAARSTLEAAAVAGASVELRVLVDLDEAGVAGALASGFLLDVGDGRVGFRHALTREALYQGTAWTRRRKLHARLCDLLEAAGAQPERVAEHAA
jgi:predicted ATPase